MNDTSPAGSDPREHLRRRWLAHAAAALDLMFHPEHQADLITFDPTTPPRPGSRSG